MLKKNIALIVQFVDHPTSSNSRSLPYLGFEKLLWSGKSRALLQPVEEISQTEQAKEETPDPAPLSALLSPDKCCPYLFNPRVRVLVFR